MSGVEGVRITGPLKEEHKAILTPDAVKFLALLHRSFDERRIRLLQNRVLRQQGFDAGQLPNFLPHTAHIREDKTWKCAPPAPGLRDRRVEITGPVDRKMVINALNSGAYTFMADFEDASSPTWANMIDGQVNMNLATFRKIDFKQASNNKEYKLKPVGQTATLIVRPRGWHLNEEHFLVDGRPISGSLFDFGLHFFHNAKELVRIGYGPYFYLPKMESHLEARLWNDAFNLAQDYISIPRGTIRGTVLIETITAVFEMEEILFELRDHSSGLNCGRWDYIFSFIKRQRYNKAAVLPDRANVTMTAPFMNAYVDLLIKTCHNRHAAAIGGMAATIPIKDDKARNDAAMDKVRADKLREVTKGHDGTWVAHPALVSVALEVFNKHMLGPNQYHIRRDEVNTTAVDLLNPVVEGAITRGGVQQNVEALLIYCQSWLDGLGCKAVNYSMEDAATGEVSRYLLWSWIYHGKSTSDDGQLITNQYVDQVLAEEKSKLKASRSLDIAEQFIKNDLRQKSPSEFLTTSLYPSLPLSGVESKL